MNDFKKTVEDAADLMEICAAGGSPGATRLLPLADALRSGLVPALERAREEERARWHRMIDGQLEVARQGIDSCHPSDRLMHHHTISVLTHIRDTWPLPATPPPTPAADAEPFCACGRRASECDGSRAGCRTQCREEEESRD